MEKGKIREILWDLLPAKDKDYFESEFESNANSFSERELSECWPQKWESEDYLVESVALERDLEGSAEAVYVIKDKKTGENTLFGWQGFYASYAGYEWDEDLVLFKTQERTVTDYIVIR